MITQAMVEKRMKANQAEKQRDFRRKFKEQYGISYDRYIALRKAERQLREEEGK